MNEMRFPRWLAAVGILGGVAIALGLPFLVFVFGGELSAGAQLALVILALVAGSATAIISTVVGLSVPTVVSGAALKLEACCPPERSGAESGVAGQSEE